MIDRIFIELYVRTDIDKMTDCDLDFIILHVSWRGSYQEGINIKKTLISVLISKNVQV